MMRHAGLRARLFATILLVAASAPAAAQYYPPAPPQQPRDYPQNDSSNANARPVEAASRADVLRAAVCVVGRDAAAADVLLGTAPFSNDERDKAVRLLRNAERCLRIRTQIATSALMFRGALAEALYETRFPEPAAARTPPAAAAALLRASAVAQRDDAAQLSTMFDLAHCSAPRQPGLVRTLLATEPSSDAESAALSALYPTFGQCVPAGTRLSIDRGGTRALLAESLYRWSVVQRDGDTSPWAAASATAAAPSN